MRLLLPARSTVAPLLSVVFVLLATPAIVSAQSTCAAPCPAPSLAAAPTPAASTADKRLAEIDAAIDQASTRGDRNAVALVLDDAMVGIDAFSGSVQTREQILQQIKPPPPAAQYKTVESDVVVKMVGEHAVVTSKKTDSWIFEGRPDSRSYRETNTYARRGDAWKLILSVHADEPPPYSPKDVAFDVPFDSTGALGDPRASVVIVEFGDYECEMCRMFARDTMTRIEKEYVKTGKAAVLFRDHPLSVHKRAFAAATAARCASDAGKRWPMSERLLKDPVALSDEDLRKAALAVGLSPASFDKCVSDPATAQKIRQGMSEASDMGVRGTPMFLVGIHRPGEAKVRGIRMVEGAVPYEVFQATLEGLLHTTAP
jgi:protein-disulfide isomerase